MSRWYVLIPAAFMLCAAASHAKDWPDEAEEAYTAAVDEHRAGRPEKSMRACRQLIEEHREFPKPYYLLAWIHSEQGEPEQAAETYRTLLARRPAELNARMYHARILLYDLREYEAAGREYRSALFYAKNDVRARERVEQGLKSVAMESRRRRTFLGHRTFLRWLLAALVAGWLVLVAVGYRFTR